MGVGAGGRAASTTLYIELCQALPPLHAAALQLLRLTLAAAGAQATPMFGAVARLLADHLGRIASSGPAAFTATPWMVGLPHPLSCFEDSWLMKPSINAVICLDASLRM